ncbi:MAG: Fe-S cluster assembly ATPase SufC [Acidobacteriota bacterium]
MPELALEVRDLRAAVEDKEILKGLNLAIPKGEVHVIMGPNGSGKSTLAHTLMGHPRYTVLGGEVYLFGDSLLTMKVHERSRNGLFLAYQHPVEVPGVTFAHFLWNAHQARQQDVGNNGGPPKKDPKAVVAFRKRMTASLEGLKMSPEFAQRHLNVGASGGEKKRLEISQMQLLNPRMVIMDEIDSGLDIDSTKVVAQAINGMKGPEFSALIITHYPRILDYLNPDRVHVMAGGRVLCSRGIELARELEQKGYDWILKEYNAN